MLNKEAAIIPWSTQYPVEEVVFVDPNRKLLAFSVWTDVYLVNGTVVRKEPNNEGDTHTEAILREATIYSMLGEHPRIAECISAGSDFIEIKYYPNGDLRSYAKENQDSITPDLLKKWFQQIVEAIVEIHEYEVIHSDLALKQFLLDDNLDARLCDFGASQYPGHIALGNEGEPAYFLPRDWDAPNSVRSGMFALGSTLYELVANKSPFSELYTDEPLEVRTTRDPVIY
ncbi:serine/threonine protein kinase [Helicocarpus griseus UAMH5409]|uniref:Serine/threonine protein kinase n=1 Tax=Helicocarpus griseus UAMH5409 TaxID=1447875 RepID=A0A2B7WIA0_9EURO|nr:serine/threonine protein kinase [Helicocarpus griseus UAMH5409]